MSRASLAVSVTGHIAAFAWLILLVRPVQLPLTPPEQKFAIALDRPTTIPEAVRPVEPPPAPAVTNEPTTVAPVPPETTASVQPQAEQPVAVPDVPSAPTPDIPVVRAVEPPTPPKPAPKPVAKTPPRPLYQQPVEPTPNNAYAPPPPVYARPAPAYAPTMAALPPPAPRPDLAASYRAMLSMWFESHKRYPDSARTNAEQGSAVVRFVVDRSGRVLTFGLLRGTGYADLDNGITEMLRGAQLPSFPSGLTISQLDVSVTLRFALTR